MIEARALKNRLSANTIGKVLQVFRDHLIEDRQVIFTKIVNDSLQNEAKTQKLINMLQQIVDQEDKFIHFDSVVEFGTDANGVAKEPVVKDESLLVDPSTSRDARIMAAIERRHKKFYLLSQILLCYDAPLASPEDYWSKKARAVLNITVE